MIKILQNSATILFNVILILLSIISCKEGTSNKITNTFSKPCECEKSIAKDSTFYATNIQEKPAGNFKNLSFNCTSVEMTVAEIIDVNGIRQCENRCNFKCASTSKSVFPLEKNFYYFKAEIREMDITPENAQKLFFQDIKDKKKGYYEFRLNKKREIQSIYKLEL